MVELSSENTYDILETAILSKENAEGADIVCQLFIEPVNVTHPHVGAQTFYFNPTSMHVLLSTYSRKYEDLTKLN